jgi:hypothetical protein
MNRVRIALLVLAAGLAAGELEAQTISASKTAGRAPAPNGVPYRSLTDTRRSVTNFNVEVVRGFVLREDEGELETFALNSYESSVVRFRGEVEVARWRTLGNPVSIALHAGDVFVVGQGNHALARHALASGRMVDVLMLPSEPADLVVDAERGVAWVSCMGADAVVQVALEEPLRIVKVWGWKQGLRLKRPRFLHLDGDGSLYVAPLVSGNNTLSLSTVTGFGDLGVVDGTTLPGGGLPDEDLFRITPGAGVEPVLRGVGSVILAHGRNPADGRYHVLTVGHNNFDPALLNEPLVRGKFADNLLAVIEPATLASGATPPPGPDRIVDLDDHDPGTPGAQYDPDRALSFPYALAFEPGTGRIAVAASTTPLVALLDNDGKRQVDLPLDGGLVPRTLAFDGAGRLHVYCQETSELRVFDPDEPGREPTVLELGNDPTPAPVRRGRRTWYDARPSADGRTTCNTCHVQGGADGIAWFLSGDPVDHKDVMVTQPLFGIEDSFPYHWRGERDLEAFNGAFPGLLGHGAALDPAELEDFVEFVFSLTAPANPLQTGPLSVDAEGRLVQDFDRLLKDELMNVPLGAGLLPFGPFGQADERGRATLGQRVFHEKPSLDGRTCVDCHAGPSGTLGDIVVDDPSPIASASAVKIAHLDALGIKHQPVVELQDAAGNTIERNLLGYGLGHKGDTINVLDFALRFLGGLSQQDVLDLAAFLHLFDSGTAPSAHYAVLLDERSPPGTAARVRRRLLDQAERGWVGAVAIGGPGATHWTYDPDERLFVPEDGRLGARPLRAFLDFAHHPGMATVFLGTPPGNERRLGIDFDDDGLAGGAERAHGTDRWNPDSDGDGWRDGHEVEHGSDPLSAASTPVDERAPRLVPGSLALDFVNARSAKLFFETDEPCTWTLTLAGPGGTTLVEDRLTPDTVHTAVVQRLLPSTTGALGSEVRNTYAGMLVLTDVAGNSSAPIPLPPITTASMIHDGGLSSVVLGDLTLTNEARSATTYAALATVRVDYKELSPPAIPAANHVVLAQVLKQDLNGLDWSIVPAADLVHDAPATELQFGGKPYGQTPGLLPGPFLIPLPTDAGGAATVDFTVLGLRAGQKVMFNVLAVFPAAANWNPSTPSIPSKFGLVDYQLPATPAALRAVVSQE